MKVGQIDGMEYGPKYVVDRSTAKRVVMTLYALAGDEADDDEIIALARMLCAPPHGTVLDHRRMPANPELAQGWRERNSGHRERANAKRRAARP